MFFPQLATGPQFSQRLVELDSHTEPLPHSFAPLRRCKVSTMHVPVAATLLPVSHLSIESTRGSGLFLIRNHSHLATNTTQHTIHLSTDSHPFISSNVCHRYRTPSQGEFVPRVILGTSTRPPASPTDNSL